MIPSQQPPDQGTDQGRLARLEAEIGHRATVADLRSTEIGMIKWIAGIGIALFAISIGLWTTAFFYLLGAIDCPTPLK